MDENPTAQTEDVLGRLDALLNRDKAASMIETTIPLLTEIYQPAAAPSTASAPAGAGLNLSPEHIEQLVQLLLPEMTRIMQDALTQHIQPALETTLRTRLQALAQQKLNL
jgi:hypothetical protein